MRSLVEEAAQNFTDSIAISYKENYWDKEVKKVSFNQWRDDVRHLGTALIADGLREEKIAIVGENFILTSRDNIIYHIPVVVGIRHHRKTGVGINLSQHTLDKSGFITIHCEVSSHNRVFGRNSTDTNAIFCALSIIEIIQIRQSRNGRGLIERQEPRCRATRVSRGADERSARRYRPKPRQAQRHCSRERCSRSSQSHSDPPSTSHEVCSYRA